LHLSLPEGGPIGDGAFDLELDLLGAAFVRVIAQDARAGGGADLRLRFG
jgi:hypothetical protein